ELRALDARIRRAESAPPQKAADLEMLWRDREALEGWLAGVADELRKAAPRYADLSYPRPCTVGEARDALRPGEVALHFLLGVDASYLILLEQQSAEGDPDGGLAVFALPPRGDIEQRLRCLTDPETLRLPCSAREAGADLYRMLLAPAAERLEGK